MFRFLIICILLTLPIMSRANYNFCWGKRKNETIFCSKLKDGKGDINYCKYWSKEQYDDRYRWGVKSNSSKSELLQKRSYFCDKIVNGDTGVNHGKLRYFYLGQYNRYSKKAYVVKYKLTDKQYKQYIIYDRDPLCSGTISCNLNNVQYHLSGNMGPSATADFTINNYNGAGSYHETLPTPHDTFGIIFGDYFATSSTFYQKMQKENLPYQGLPYYKNVTMRNPEELFDNYGQNVNWGDLSCNYIISCE